MLILPWAFQAFILCIAPLRASILNLFLLKNKKENYKTILEIY